MACRLAPCPDALLGGGRGVLPGGVPGVYPAGRAVVIGGGGARLNAATVAAGHGFRRPVPDKDVDACASGPQPLLRPSWWHPSPRTPTPSSRRPLEADLVLRWCCTRCERRSSSPTTRLANEAGGLLVDIAIDQGGCFEDSRFPTTHADPTFEVHDSVFYCRPTCPAHPPHVHLRARRHASPRRWSWRASPAGVRPSPGQRFLGRGAGRRSAILRSGRRGARSRQPLRSSCWAKFGINGRRQLR